jgi:hypothetical protein
MSDKKLIDSHLNALAKLKFFAQTVLRGDLTDEQLVYRVDGKGSHILWLTGHITLALDLFFGIPLGTDRMVSRNFMTLFMTGREPTSEASDYPPFEELKQGVGLVIGVLESRVRSMTDDDLLEPFPKDSPIAKFSTHPDEHLHNAIYHTAYHLGQISMLKKQQGLPTGLES